MNNAIRSLAIKLFICAIPSVLTAAPLTLKKLDTQCAILENYSSTISYENYPSWGSAVSNNRLFLASYNYIEPKSEAVFKLWDTVTGKHLKTNTVGNFEERSSQTDLNFSPDNHFVYLEGMSYLAAPDESINHYPKNQPNIGEIPFWNIATNKVVMSPCSTAMGVGEVQFSNDHKVAYVETVDSHHSLCSTFEKKLFATNQHIYPEFHPKIKQLFLSFADKDYTFFHQLEEYIAPSDVSGGMYINFELTTEGLTENTLPKLPITHPKAVIPEADDTLKENPNYAISGVNLADQAYDRFNLYKHDQYLIFPSKEQFLVLNWQTGISQIIKFDSKSYNEWQKPHWISELQLFLLVLHHDDEKVSLNTYDPIKNNLETLFVTDSLFHYKSVVNAKGQPELHYIKQDKTKIESQYCRVSN